jgi:lipid A disaccharide synthetase
MVVTYHLPPLSRVLARAAVRTRCFALPNVLMRERVVAERLEPGPGWVVSRAGEILRSASEREAARHRLERVVSLLGPPGAMKRVARLVLDLARRAPGS